MKELFFTHDGRIPRSQFWKGTLILTGLNLLVQIPLNALIYGSLTNYSRASSSYSGSPADQQSILLSVLVTLVLLYPSVCIGIKRCHDRGRTGWFYLVMVVPILNLWAIVELFFLRGTSGENRFGPDMLGGLPVGSHAPASPVSLPPNAEHAPASTPKIEIGAGSLAQSSKADNVPELQPFGNAPASFTSSQSDGWVLSGLDSTGRPLRVFFSPKDFENVKFLWIGRNPEENGIQIVDNTVSRKHARLGFDGTDLWLIDANSKNGTYVEGVQIASAGGGERLAEGAQIEFGKTKVILSTSSVNNQTGFN